MIPLTTTSQLGNISTRGFVSTGDSVMIGGFITGPGTDDGKILVRAIGPSLMDADVPGALMDPTLEVFNENGDSIGFNDDWQDTAGDEILATGLAPSQSAESAMLFVQVAGSYTVVVRGVDNTSGIGLVEAYHLSSTPGREVDDHFQKTCLAGDTPVAGEVFFFGGSTEFSILPE